MAEVDARAAGCRCAWVSSAARRIVPSPPITSASSQSRAGVGLVVGRARGRVERRSSPRSAASSAQQPDHDAVARSAPCTNARATSRASSRPVWASSSTRRGTRGLRGLAARSRVHLLTRHPRRPARPHTAGGCRRRRSSAGPRRSHRKNSTLPDGPGQRAGRHRPGAPAARGRGRRPPSATASARSAGSRTTPPLPTRSLPTSNCGLTISTRSPSARRHADQRRRAPARGEMNDRSPTTRSTGPPISLGGRARGRWCGRAPRTRSSCRSGQASCP